MYQSAESSPASHLALTVITTVCVRLHCCHVQPRSVLHKCFESDFLNSQDNIERVNVLDNVCLRGCAGNYLPEAR